MKPEKPEKSNVKMDQFLADMEKRINALTLQIHRDSYYFWTLVIWFAHLEEERQSPFPACYLN